MYNNMYISLRPRKYIYVLYKFKIKIVKVLAHFNEPKQVNDTIKCSHRCIKILVTKI